jgi:hypothetical protein
LLSGELAAAEALRLLPHAGVLLAYAIVGFYVATVLTRRRLLK